MKENEFGLSVKTKEYGYVQFPRLANRHSQKSKAGKMFWGNPNVLSVCVYDKSGNGEILSLKKDPITGECTQRIES